MTVLTNDQKLTLSNHLTTDPNGRGYAADITSKNIGEICTKLNLADRPVPRLRKITTLHIMDECWTVSKGIIDKLNTASGVDSRVAEALIYLRGPGLDINNTKTQEMFTAIGFTQAEIDALTSMAIQHVSEMTVLELPFATDEIVWEALA